MKQSRKKKCDRKVFLSRILFILLFHLVSVSFVHAQRVTGKVVDEVNEPMIGVTVQIKGASQGAITNLDGEYSINVTGTNSVLVFTMIGYKTQEIAVGNKTNINVVMQEDNKLLDEVVVVGFQSQKKVNLTGSVSAIGADALENRPVSNIGQALQGVMPNLNVSFSNGAPNTDPSYNVRGGTSIRWNSTDSKWEVKEDGPLILIDGIQAGAGILQSMNPGDIQSISLLKDASASAIYGTRANFGVLLVTTKSGSFGQKAKINYSYDIQWDKPSHIPDILDSYTLELAGINRRIWRNQQDGYTNWDEEVLGALKKYQDNPIPENAWIMNGANIKWVANTNPFDLLVRDSAPTQKHNFSVTAGTDKISYHISLGLQDQEGMYKINTDDFKRYNALLSLNAKVTDYFSLAAKVIYNYNIYKSPNVPGGKGTVWNAMLGEPGRNINMPLMSGPNDPMPNTWTDNIVGWVADGTKAQTEKTTAYYTISPEWTIIPEVKIKADFSYRPTTEKYMSLIPKRSYLGTSWTSLDTNHSASTQVTKRRQTGDLYTVNLFADFNKTFAQKHTISGVLGYNQEYYRVNYLQANGSYLMSSDVPYVHASELAAIPVSEYDQENATRGVFGRINYNFSDRYLFEVNGRYDGSSRFPKNDRFKFFPSFSGAWRVSEEPFMAQTKSWLNSLKIRGSYGSVGNQPSDNYPTFATMGVDKLYYMFGGSAMSYVKNPALVPESITWEKVTTINGGLDVIVLNNRLEFGLDVYQRKTSDILLPGQERPALLGTAVPNENVGTLKANGWEISLKWRDRLSNGFSYGVGVVLSDAKTKVVKYTANELYNLGTKANGQVNMYQGMTLGEIWGYETDRILQKGDIEFDANGKFVGFTFTNPDGTPFVQNPGALATENETNKSQWYPGDVLYKDINGDGKVNMGKNTVDDHGDLKIIGNSTPRLRYSLNLDAAYKGFDLTVFFQGIGKRDVWLDGGAYWGDGAGSRYMYDNSWTPDRTNARFPMYGVGGQNRYAQTGYLISGAYLRLKQVVLGYTLPKSLTSKIKLDRVRFNLSAYNLFEITDIPSFYDPDQISNGYPQKRSMALGVQIGF